MTTLDILIEARARLAKPGGWIQGRLWDGVDGYCAIGAIRSVVETNPYFSQPSPLLVDPMVRLALALPERSCQCVPFVPHYNDERGRTKEDILALFDKAIEAERGRITRAIDAERALAEPVEEPESVYA